MRVQSKTILTVSLAVLLSAAALAFMSADERDVAMPGLACMIMMLWLWMTLWKRDQKIPFFDVGIFCALATLLYTVYPLVNYWADGLQFGILSDGRLRSYNISPAELGFFHLRHVLYFASFVVFYVAFRGKGAMEVGNVNSPCLGSRQLIFLIFFLLLGYFVFLKMTTGVNFNSTYEPEAYQQNLSNIRSLPLVVLQISGKLWSILFVFKLGVLYIVVRKCKDRKWLIVLLVWIAAEVISAVFLKGARTGLVLFVMAAALLYHRIVKHFTMKYLIAAGAALFAFFIFLGLYRAYANYSDLQSVLSQSGRGFLASNNEFQSLLGTAYDVLQRKESGAFLPWYLYINDIISILPPQQILPFEKVAASEWYLREIGLSGTGQGRMWGVITQSIVGLDWLELFFRGAILGFILAQLHRWYLKYQSDWMATIVYLYFCLNAYYTFRSVTFSLLANLVWQILPFYFLLRILPYLLPDRESNEQVR